MQLQQEHLPKMSSLAWSKMLYFLSWNLKKTAEKCEHLVSLKEIAFGELKNWQWLRILVRY